MEIEVISKEALRINIQNNESKEEFICKICQLPYSDPLQCELCENIFCNNCIIEYVFNHSTCPSSCKTINLIKITRLMQTELESQVLQCSFCEIKLNPLQFQQHVSQIHKCQFENIDFTNKLKILPRSSLTQKEQDEYKEQIQKLINIEEEINEEIRFTMKCSVCLKYLNHDSSQCFNCQNVWCANCVKKYQRNNSYYCFNRCAPQNFINIQQSFKNKYFNKYKTKCEECEEWVKVEDHTQHLKQYHSQQIAEDKQLAYLYYQYGGQQMKKQDYEKAKQYFIQGLSQDYSYTSLWFQKALCYSKLGKFKEAVINYKEDLKFQEDACLYFNIGVNLKKLQLTQQAIESYRKSIEIDSKFYKSYNNLGCCLHKLGLLDEAIEIFDKGIAINESYCSVYDSKASVLFDMKQFKQAFELYQKSIDLDPNYYYPYLGRGKCYYEFGNYKEAEKDLLIFINNQEKEQDQANNLLIEVQNILKQQKQNNEESSQQEEEIFDQENKRSDEENEICGNDSESEL